MAKDLDLDDVADGHYLAVQELAALRKDAERYRKLRDSPISDVRIIGIGKRSGVALDDAADAIPPVFGAA